MEQSRWARALVVLAVIILSTLLAAGIVALLLRVGGILLLFFLAAFLAFALMPLVDIIARPGVPRPLAILIAYLGLAAVLAGVGFLVVPPLIDQTNQLINRLPDLAQQAQSSSSGLSALLKRLGLGVSLANLSAGLVAQLQTIGKLVLTNIFGIARQVTTAVVDLVLVLVIAFYFLNEGRAMRSRLDRAVPAEHHARLLFLEDAVARVVGGYLRGQLIVAVMVGVLAGGAAALLGVNYAVVIGALAGLFELIPFFGPVLGAIPAIGIAAFEGPLPRVVAVLIAFIIIQQVESNLIGPRITGEAVGLHPLLVMFSILVGVELAGIWGAVFGVPVMGVAVAVAQRLYHVGRTSPADPQTGPIGQVEPEEPARELTPV
ncbi:MAG: AI-2E family transporter [Chloroflexota bacterium]